MIKYFCDICDKETSENNLYKYILPIRSKKVEYEPTWVDNKGTTKAITHEAIEDQCLMICQRCRTVIAHAIDKEKS